MTVPLPGSTGSKTPLPERRRSGSGAGRMAELQ